MDANMNRAKEALRVCEDICRFFYDQPSWTRQWKDIRHRLTAVLVPLDCGKALEARDIGKDVGKRTTFSESRRFSAGDVFRANAQRAKESLRVLEECAKLSDQGAAESLKKLRYRLYALEQKVLKGTHGRDED